MPADVIPIWRSMEESTKQPPRGLYRELRAEARALYAHLGRWPLHVHVGDHRASLELARPDGAWYRILPCGREDRPDCSCWREVSGMDRRRFVREGRVG